MDHINYRSLLSDQPTQREYSSEMGNFRALLCFFLVVSLITVNAHHFGSGIKDHGDMDEEELKGMACLCLNLSK